MSAATSERIGECAACGGDVEVATDGKVTINCSWMATAPWRKCEVVKGLSEIGIRIVDGRLKRDA